MAAKCPYLQQGYPSASTANENWWPNSVNLKLLSQNNKDLNPLGKDFDYAKEFETVDLDALKADIEKVMTDSKDFWPADYGHYGPFFVRMAWHSAGTYRSFDGRGGAGSGQLRFAPLNSWPDNQNLDRSRRLLWPVKQKYGAKISWADLMIYTGNCAIESMGLPMYGFGGGREDVYGPEDHVYWGPEDTWLDNKRYTQGGYHSGGARNLQQPLGAVQMGLIYVNPEGPDGKPDPIASALDIRDTFGRMSMNDEETVALIAGGHAFGKAHGAGPGEKVGPEPEGAPLEQQGIGWKNGHGSGNGGDSITSGFEGAWTANPTKWDNGYLTNLFKYDWELFKSPTGNQQWKPKNYDGPKVPDAHAGKSDFDHPIMFTSDLALKMDPIYGPISKRFHDNPEELGAAFSKAWFKLCHRDLGPIARYKGKKVGAPLIWQDPVGKATTPSAADVEAVKAAILSSGLTTSQLVTTAWASASTFRQTDKRGGANGARICLEPQKGWAVNKGTADVVAKLKELAGGKLSVADAIVLGGCAAVEAAAKKGGVDIKVPFTPGRADATQEQTDAESFAVLEPKADGFRNFYGDGNLRAPEHTLIDKAFNLELTAPQMTVLIGGLRALGATVDGSSVGVLTATPGTLDNSFFVKLLGGIDWGAPADGIYSSADGKWKGTAVDLIFGHHSQLRAIAEEYACDGTNPMFVKDFVAAWTKVMELDRFDLHK